MLEPGSRAEDRPEPGAVVPAPLVGRARVHIWVLVRHVHVREPEAALGLRKAREVLPGGVLRRDGGGLGQEALVLDHQRDLVGRQAAGGDALVDHALLGGVLEEVRAGHARVHVESRDAQSVIVEPEQPGALVVGVVVGLRAGSRIRRAGRGALQAERRVRDRVEDHVGHVPDADAALVHGRLAGRRDPLVGRAVADPHRIAAVKVEHGAVLGVVAGGIALGTHAGAHHGGVHRQEELAVGACRQVVGEPQPDRRTVLGDDHRAEIGRRGVRVDLGAAGVEDGAAVRIPERHMSARGGVGWRLELHVAAQRGWIREVPVQLLAVLHDGELVVVTARERGRVRLGRPQVGQRVDELAQAERAEGPVRIRSPVVGDG